MYSDIPPTPEVMSAVYFPTIDSHLGLALFASVKASKTDLVRSDQPKKPEELTIWKLGKKTDKPSCNLLQKVMLLAIYSRVTMKK